MRRKNHFSELHGKMGIRMSVRETALARVVSFKGVSSATPSLKGGYAHRYGAWPPFRE